MSKHFQKTLIIIIVLVATGAGLVLAFNNPTQPPPNGEISFWRISGNNIYYNAGSVGIGISAPSYKLHVSGGSIYASGYIRAGTQLCIGSDCRTAWSDIVPSGGIAFFATVTCPAGWTEATAARGRYIVGASSTETLAGTVGQALINLENRPVGQHTHDVNDPGHSHLTNGTMYYNSGFVGSFGNGDRTFLPGYTDVGEPNGVSYTGITVSSTGAVAGTNAPYIQFLVCQKI